MRRRTFIAGLLVAAAAGRSASLLAENALQAALDAASPGDVVVLPDGEYVGNFVMSRSGSEEAPIRIEGTRAAVLRGEGWEHSGYALHLDGVAWVEVVGLSITNAQKGVMCDGCDHITLRDLEVFETGHEAIHLRTHTTNSLVEACDIHDTGLKKAKFGEGA